MAEPGRVIPTPTPETQHYWDGAKQGELRIQACNSCSENYFPPRPFCPKCGSRDVKVVKASGKGRLYSYIINHSAITRLHATVHRRDRRTRRRRAPDDQSA